MMPRAVHHEIYQRVKTIVEGTKLCGLFTGGRYRMVPARDDTITIILAVPVPDREDGRISSIESQFTWPLPVDTYLYGDDTWLEAEVYKILLKMLDEVALHEARESLLAHGHLRIFDPHATVGIKQTG